MTYNTYTDETFIKAYEARTEKVYEAVKAGEMEYAKAIEHIKESFKEIEVMYSTMWTLKVVTAKHWYAVRDRLESIKGIAIYKVQSYFYGE